MYKCPGCGIEHEFDICPYCGRLKQKQASPSSLRLREDAADINRPEDGQMKLTSAAGERLRKNARDGHRPPPAPKNQPDLFRDVSPVFTPDPSFTIPEEPEVPIKAEPAPPAKAAEKTAHEAVYAKTKEESPKASAPSSDDDAMTAYFAAVAAQLTAAAKIESKKDDFNVYSLGETDDDRSADRQAKTTPCKAQGKATTDKPYTKEASIESNDLSAYFDDDSKPLLSPTAADADSPAVFSESEAEHELEPIVDVSAIAPKTRAEFCGEADYNLTENDDDTPTPHRLSTERTRPTKVRADKKNIPKQKPIERISANEYFLRFFRCMFSGELAEAMEISANGGVYYGWIFGIIGIAAGALCGLTGMKLIGTNAFASISSAIGGGIILRLETIAVLTLLVWISTLVTGSGAGLGRSFSLACVTTLPTFIFSALALGAAWLYQPLALPVLLCPAVFTALNLYGAAKALGILGRKGGFILFCTILSVYFILTGLIIGSML